MQRSRSMEPLVPLTEFQREWVLDNSRFKIAVKPRRAGFTFAATLEVALDLVEERTKWLIVSRTQDTAKEAIKEIRNHFAAMQKVAEAGVQIQEIETDLFFHDLRVTKFFHYCPVKSRIESAGQGHRVSFRGSRTAARPVKWAFSRKG